jgi:hypothetical protein
VLAKLVTDGIVVGKLTLNKLKHEENVDVNPAADIVTFVGIVMFFKL